MAEAIQAPVMAVKDVTKKFGDFTAVSGINIEVQQGEIFGFLGPNGAGKSTTIRLLLDILRPDSGSIELLGRPNRQARDVHREIGFLSGEMAVDTDLTGHQYLEFINQLHGGNHHHTTAALADLLEADTSKKIGDYSRGNRQKIGLIAALLHRPKLLVLDEPTSGFDPLIQERFAAILQDYVKSGGTVFMSSHILAEVQHLCDRVAFIRDGHIISTTSVHDLLDSNAKRIDVSASADVIHGILKEYGNVVGLSLAENHDGRLVFSYTGPIPALLDYFAGKDLSDITIREPELEEIFGRYYEGGGTADKQPGPEPGKGQHAA